MNVEQGTRYGRKEGWGDVAGIGVGSRGMLCVMVLMCRAHW